MTSKPRLSEILTRCEEAYDSLTSTNYAFVERAIQQAPYARVLKEVETRFTIVDDTDLNDDVCFFSILKRRDKSWGLLLSMVGPYGLFMRIAVPRCVVLTRASTALEDIEQEVMDLVSSQGIHLLETDILEEIVDFQNPTTAEVEPSTLFRVLFTDTDILPWRGLETQG